MHLPHQRTRRCAAKEVRIECTCHIISSITYAELCDGAAYSARVEDNFRELEEFCLDLAILPFDAAAGVHYGEIRQALTRRGRIIGANDLLIAAHARSAGAALVTNNEGEFGRVSDFGWRTGWRTRLR